MYLSDPNVFRKPDIYRSSGRIISRIYKSKYPGAVERVDCMERRLIGVISDTHLGTTDHPVFTDICNYFGKRRVDLIVHCGDIGTYDVIKKLGEIAPVNFVRGNMDFEPEIMEAPEYLTFTVLGKKFGVIHGWGGPTDFVPRIYGRIANGSGDIPGVVFCGHTHNHFTVDYKGVLFINPGSPTDRIYSRTNTVTVVEVIRKEGKVGINPEIIPVERI